MDIRTEPAGMNLDWELRRLLEVDAWLPPAFYSTDWDGAGQVIDAMQRRGWWVRIEQTGDVWFACNFWNWKSGVYSETVHFQTFPHAITIAAILALRSEAEHGDTL